jgi:ABC-type multidrug transport system fused ATPase/permease subunit
MLLKQRVAVTDRQVILSLIPLLQRLWPHITNRRRKQLAVISGLMLVSTVAELVSIGAVLPFLGVLAAPNKVLEQSWAQFLVINLGLTESEQLLFTLTLIFGLSVVFASVARLLLIWGQTRLSFAVGGDLSLDVYRRTLYQPYSVHSSRNSSQVIAGVINKVGNLGANTLLPIMNFFTATVILFSIMAFLIVVNPLISVAAFISLGSIYIVILLLTKNQLAKDGYRENQESSRSIKALQEGMGSIRDVLLDGTQEVCCHIYDVSNRALRRAGANIIILSAAPRFIVEGLGMLLIGTLAYVMVSRPGEGGVVTAIAVLGALALGAQRTVPLLQQIYSSLITLRGKRAMLIDALELLEQSLPAYADNLPPAPLVFQQAVCLENLSFRYDLQGPWVLRNVNLCIPRGSRVGFVGNTGSGKSTLLDIIMGLLIPGSGSLRVDGIEVTYNNHRAWQMHIAHVPQAIYLADTSIAQNIAFGIPHDSIDWGRVKEAAQRAQISSTIESWERGYQTFVGERGVRLSGGQLQRIGIARALYKQADVLVLDEATSALDSNTESAVMEAIDELDKNLTILIVAHRLSTLRNCTKIIELREGQVARVGGYEEVVMNSGAL